MRAEENAPVILVVEDETEVRKYLEIALRADGYIVESVENGEEALHYLELGLPVAAVLLDVILPERNGLQILREIRHSMRDLPVIMMSGMPSSGIIVEAMRERANDFLSKPISHESLQRALVNLLGTLDPEIPQAPSPTHSSMLFFGSSACMRRLRSMVDLVASSEAPVVIQGETGAGKEVLARHLHSHSQRNNRFFVKVNCAALPSELVESELFGYERGAFTGAFDRKTGMFEIADGGTLLLDEIGDMDFKLQAKLLQVLQDHEFQRLGGGNTVRVDVRVIAATHNDLEQAIAAGQFRQDLYYRLNVMSLYMPPLRERKEDIVPLTRFLMQRHSGNATPAEITPALERALLQHHWPGNVRELENVVRKLIVIQDPEMVIRDLATQTARRALTTVPVLDLPANVAAVPSSAPILERVSRVKHLAETEAILAALNTTHWNRKKAATLLRVDYKSLLYKMKKLGIYGDSSSMYDFARVAGADTEPV